MTWIGAIVAAVLLASGRREGAPVIDRAAFQRTQVETEIGFVVGQPIGQALPSLASLRERIAAIMPAIELPDLGFADRTKLTGRDLIAANGGAAQFIVGPETPVGARGVGEPPDGAGYGAVMNAIADAIGVDAFRRAPVTADIVLMSLEHGKRMHEPLRAHL